MYDRISQAWLHISGLITYCFPGGKPWHLRHNRVEDTTVHHQASDMCLITMLYTRSYYCVRYTWDHSEPDRNFRSCGKENDIVDTLISFEIPPCVPWIILDNSRCYHHDVMIERIYILCLIIMKSEVWTITRCLGLGHGTIVSAVCLSIFLSSLWSWSSSSWSSSSWSSSSSSWSSSPWSSSSPSSCSSWSSS